MPKVTEEYRNDRRALITRAAAHCFATKGVHQSSMSDIIAASGLSAGAIYNHFKGKEEIIVSVAVSMLKERMVRLVEAAEEAGEGVPPSRLVATVLTLLREARVDDDKPLGALMIQFWAESMVNPVLLTLMQDQLVSVRELMMSVLQRWARGEQAMSPADAARWADRTSHVLISITTGFIVQQAIFPGFDEETYLATAQQIIGSVTTPPR